MKRQKLSSEQQEQHAAAEQQQSQQQSGLEFATPEEMLRHDAKGTVVPPGIAQRLRESTASLPQPPQSWWKKLFNK
jgi:hypothetical protein